jgi:hypothetical protein
VSKLNSEILSRIVDIGQVVTGIEGWGVFRHWYSSSDELTRSISLIPRPSTGYNFQNLIMILKINLVNLFWFTDIRKFGCTKFTMPLK